MNFEGIKCLKRWDKISLDTGVQNPDERTGEVDDTAEVFIQKVAERHKSIKKNNKMKGQLRIQQVLIRVLNFFF